MFLKPSNERVELVEWVFTQIEPDLEKMKVEEVLTMLGVCTSTEAASKL